MPKGQDTKKRKTATGAAAPPLESRSTDTSPARVELLDKFKKLRKSWPKEMARLLDPSLPDERRSELWEMMCLGGDELRQRFSWAIPDERALRIMKHFGPIVEVGSGQGYWAMLLRARGVDINAYDKAAGKPDADTVESKSAEAKATKGEKGSKLKGTDVGEGRRSKSGAFDEAEGEGEERPSFWIEVKEGGPEVLEEPCNEGRSLFLCYPDDFEGETESLGLRCLHSFEGDVVLHVGELFGDSVSMTPGQSPWGRTTSQDCQEELASKFHCILKVPLPSWPHSRDTLTVWKRHSFCAIHYGDDSEDDSGDGSEGESETPNGENGIEGGGIDKDARKGSRAALGNASGAFAPADGSSSSAEELAREAREARSGDVPDDDEDDDSDGSPVSDSDDIGSMEGLPIGVPDVDMYAFIPGDERISCAQAAPCVRFLLDG
ncbi:unnamed protein product [Hapterophycus canaliculatus]